MHRQRLTMFLIVLGACFVGLMAWTLGVAAGPAAGQVKAQHAPKVTLITVTEGKPSELGITMSKFSMLKAGTFTFKVINKGQIAHNFQVCTTPGATTAIKCKGPKTKDLDPGKSATLTVILKKNGKYEVLCAIPGHAFGGMKAVIGVGVKVAATKAVTTPVTSGGGGSTGGGDTTTKPCGSPQSSTVTVSMFEFGYTLSPSSVPCGPVTFNIKNAGTSDHDFVIEGLVGSGRSPIIGPGESTTMTATLTPQSWTYYCSVPTHRSLGMEGKLTAN
jgi:uncharacterized cupredoxin-like copper-binding protein